MNELILNSAYISLFIQIITGIVTFIGIFIKLKPEDYILNEILIIETFVQIIEFIFYVWLIYALKSSFKDVTPVRYIDWVITTPTMLVGTIFFMMYNKKEEFENINENKNENKQNLRAMDIIKKDYKLISEILIYNTLMLLFGYLGEINYLDKYISFGLGTIFLFLTFGKVYYNYVLNNTTNDRLFKFMFFFWSLYGVAYLLSYDYKNAMYNILDVFAKNFYGLFIFYLVYTVKNSY